MSIAFNEGRIEIEPAPIEVNLVDRGKFTIAEPVAPVEGLDHETVSRLKDGELIVPAAALIETYSVMTRLPSPHRLSPKDAREILSRSFEKKAAVVGLTGSET